MVTPSRRIVWGLSALLGLVIAVSLTSPVQADQAIDAVVDEFNATPRRIRAGQQILAISYVEIDGDAYGYAVPRRMARLADVGETFRIAKVKARKDLLLVKFTTAADVALEVRLFGRGKLPADKRAAVMAATLRDLFDFGAAPQRSQFVGNTESKLVHLGNCNHLPEASKRTAYSSLEFAAKDGYRPCPSCFALTSFILMEDYSQARIAALENSRVFEIIYPPVADPDLQARVDAAAERVLNNFPIDLLGFDYEFKVVRSSVMQAHALSTGFVYLTDQLMGAIESDPELEFILAHEVAHCELHLAPNKPAYHGPLDTRINPADMIERAADLLAVECLCSLGRDHLEVQGARRILAKLQFANELVPLPEEGRWSVETHLAQRLALFDDQKYVPSQDKKLVSVSAHQENVPIEVRPLGWSQGDRTAQVFLLVSGTDLLNKPRPISRLYGYTLSLGSSRKYVVKPTWSSDVEAETSIVLEFEGPREMYEDLCSSGIVSMDLARIVDTDRRINR